MCTDTIPVLAYVKIELFFADICYYQRINPKPITDMAKKIAEQLINTLAESGVERIYAVTGDSLNEVNEAVRKNNKILNSFPPDLAKDVRRVLDMLVMKNDDISSRYYIVNLGGLNIAIPERVYMREQTPSNMTAVQRNILDCIFTRHNNGFVRQRHLQNLISCTEYWTIPFCFKLLGEYVDNILYDVKKHLECNMDSYLRFIGENEKFFNRTKNQMISYWNCYYRSRFPNKELYIGFNIFNNLEMAYNNRLNLP